MLFTESAAPPRVSESNFVRMTPVSETFSSNSRAISTAFWPVMASATRSTSSGAAACADPHQLRHQGFVHLEATRGVHDDGVKLLAPGAGKSRFHHAHRVRDRFPVNLRRRPFRRAPPAAPPPRDAAGPPRPGAACGPSPSASAASLAAVVVLPEPWRPGKQDDRLRVGPLQRQALVLPSQERDHPVIDDLDELLARA